MPYSKSDYITYVNLGDGREANFRDEDAIHTQDFLTMLGELDAIRVLCDIFHPVGSCFETSDPSFNPNQAWGGTWVLEEQGKVHISAGASFPVGRQGGSESRTITLSGNTGSTVLTDAQIAHGHSFTQPTVNGGSVNIPSSGGHSHTIAAKYTADTLASGSSRDQYSADGTSVHTGMAFTSTNGAHTHTVPAHTHTVSGGAVRNLYGASSVRKGHTHSLSGITANINLMQPYVAYNRWIRTA